MQGEWQPIETAPKDGRYVIAARFGGDQHLRWVQHSRWVTAVELCDLNFDEDASCYEDGWTDGRDEQEPCFPTHWLPLPAAPSFAADRG